MKRKFLSALIVLAALVSVPAREVVQSSSVLPADLLARAAAAPIRVIVSLAVSPEPSTIARAQQAALDALPGLVEAPTRFETIPAFAVTTDRDGLERLARLPMVTSIRLDRALEPLLYQTPNIVQADRLWVRGTEAFGWSVAILDTGVDADHPFFTGRVNEEACFSTESPSTASQSTCPGRVSATSGPGTGRNCTNAPGCDHGTAVAGVAAGRQGTPYQGVHLNGMARSANVVSMQVYSIRTGATNCGGSPGPCLRANASDATLALERVRQLAVAGRQIGAVNLSMGAVFEQALFSGDCDAQDPAMAQAIANLRALNIPVVVAAGHDNASVGFFNAIAFPACMSGAIAVAATSKDDLISTYSNASAQVDLLAPGFQSAFQLAGIRTSGLRNPVDNEPYLFPIYGSSLAAAHVSGGWTLLRSTNPELTVDEILRGLQITGRPVLDTDSGLTFPRINLSDAEGTMGPAGSPSFINPVAVGQTVNIYWNGPLDGTTPASYVVEIYDMLTGALTARVNTGTSQAFFATLAPSRYRVRVGAVTSSGAVIQSSFVGFNVAVVAATVPPHIPQQLRAVVTNQDVSLSWNLPTDSAPATSYVIEVGSLPGLTNFGSFDTGSGTAGITVHNVQPGTYWVRVRARNQFGVSPASSDVLVNITGSGCVLPLPPSSLNSTVTGSTVTLNWQPPAVVGTITAYVIEVGSTPGAANIARVTTSSSATVFTTTSAPSGTYYVRVRAQSACGLTSPSNEVVVVVP